MRNLIRTVLFSLFTLTLSLSFCARAQPPTLKLAVEPSPPFSHLDESGNIKGLEVDLAQALATTLNLPLQTVPCPWARCLKMAEQGDVDIIVGLSKTMAREGSFVFLEPAFISSILEISTYQRVDASSSITTLEDLRSLKVGVQRGAMHFPDFDNDPLITKIYVKDIQTLFSMLLIGRIDAFVMPTIAADEYMAILDKEGQIRRARYNHFVEQGGFIALSKLSPLMPLSEDLHTALAALKQSGELDVILSKYNL